MRLKFMKKKRILTYLAAFVLPVLIFLLCALLNSYLPFGDEVLNAYDSYTQYPGILLETLRGLKSGNLFYSFKGGLGFSLFGTATYYAFSPLQLLALLATPMNYPYFIAFMTFLRFGLLGLTMCFYLDHKKLRATHTVLFSTLFSLMGFTSAYYYNFMWVDAIILLPLVIHGLDKLIDGEEPTFYIVFLAATIFVNYYIGYMVCIFCLLWFFFRTVGEQKKGLFKRFLWCSFLAGCTCAVVLLPSFFALMAGKAEMYGFTEYFGISKNALSFLYTLMPCSFQMSDQSSGPGLIYSGILSVVATVFYFFLPTVPKKKKLVTLAILLFFYLSLSLHFLNYAWQFFQSPIWWPSRFSFLFSFFVLCIASETLNDLDHLQVPLKSKVCISIVGVVGIVLSAFYKWNSVPNTQVFTYFYLGFSLLIFLELIFLLDKKGFLVMIMLFTFVEVSLNTFNNLKTNYRYVSVSNYHYLKKDMPEVIEKLNVENDGLFYRLEMTKKFTSNDGMYFGYNGLNFFSSVRNGKTMKILERLGLDVYNDCHVELQNFDPVSLSLLGVKYLYGSAPYFEEVENRLLVHPYPLSLGFLVEEDVKDFELGEDSFVNKNELVKTMTGLDDDLYTRIDHEKFEYKKEGYENVYELHFTSDGHYLLFLEDLGGDITVDGVMNSIDKKMIEIQKGSEVSIAYRIVTDYQEEEVYLTALHVDRYEEHMTQLDEVMEARTNVNGHLVEGVVEVSKDKSFLFTSIPFEEGMTVSVDEEKVDFDVVLGGFIGLELSSGQHVVTVDYQPQGLKAGAIISVTSVAMTVFYLQKRRKAL